MQTDATMLAKNPNNSQQCSDLLRPFAWAFSGGGGGGGGEGGGFQRVASGR